MGRGEAAISSEVLVAAILFVFIAAAFIIFLYIFTKYRWGSGSATMRARVHLVFVPERDSNLPASHGLDPAVVRSLPVSVYKVRKGSSESMECSVCLSELVDGEKARMLPKCNHGFHLDCIDKWFLSHSTCPLCRNPVEANPADGSLPESHNLPANVLFWGSHDRASVCGGGGMEGSRTSSVPSSSTSKLEGVLVIDIPSCTMPKEDAKSPAVTPSSTRLKSFSRLLSREKKVIPGSSCSGDVENGGTTTDRGDYCHTH